MLSTDPSSRPHAFEVAEALKGIEEDKEEARKALAERVKKVAGEEDASAAPSAGLSAGLSPELDPELDHRATVQGSLDMNRLEEARQALRASRAPAAPAPSAPPLSRFRN